MTCRKFRIWNFARYIVLVGWITYLEVIRFLHRWAEAEPIYYLCITLYYKVKSVAFLVAIMTTSAHHHILIS